MTGLCPDCSDEWFRWLDTRPSMLRGIRIANGAASDDTPMGNRSNRQNRYADWAAIVRFQQNLITEQCARDHAPAADGGLFPHPERTARRLVPVLAQDRARRVRTLATVGGVL